MNTGIKRSLLYGLGLSLALLFISSIASYFSITNLIKSTKMVRTSNYAIENLNNVLSVLKDAETGQRGFLLTGDSKFLEPYSAAKEESQHMFQNLSSLISNDEIQLKNFEELKFNVKKRMEILDQNLTNKKLYGVVTSDQLMAGKRYMDATRSIIAKMQAEENTLLEARVKSANLFASFTPILIVFAALLAIAITLFFYRKISASFDERLRLQEELEEKNLETENRIIAIEKVAGQISQGDYNIRLDKITEDGLGSLSGSLNKMAESLQYSVNLLEDKEWLQTGIAMVNESMVGEKMVEALAKDVLFKLIEYTESQLGAIYLFETDGRLHRMGTYAMEGIAQNQTIAVGEGLVGQCFQSGRMMRVENIPDNEATISYATGKTKARNLVIFRITRDNRNIGVIELATLTDYSELDIEFLRSISGNIGLAFYAAQNRKKLQELLEETQAQAEELQSQHTELESMNAELEAQTLKLQASEEELRVQQEELLQSNQELEERTNLLEEKNRLIEERNLDIQQKSKQLELSTKYKSEFLANMSHELRTPLNSILLLSKLMSESEELPAQYVEYAQVMQSSGQGLLSLIDEILDLSKIEAGKMKLEITEMKVSEVVHDMRSLFTPLAEEKHLKLIVHVDNDANLAMNTDRLRLEQILRNLLSNAIKFTADGHVMLSVATTKSQNRILFEVSDTGIGIPKEKWNLVFEAFQQADGSTRRRFGGTGLGLSISRELARLLGGEIILESAEGKGSKFTLSIPVNFNEKVNDEKINDEHQSATEEEAGTAKRYVVDHIPDKVKDNREDISEEDKVILIVEDDTAFAKILSEYAQTKKYKTIIAVSGDEGIELAQKYKPIAILLDIQLPVMDGWQVMEALKANPKTRPIPVHIMSSMAFKQESLLKGAVDFIDKPFALEQMNEIFKKLENVLSKHPKKVLIVEENPQHAKALGYFLGTHQISSQIVKDLSGSVDALNNKEIDCVILDMGIPDKGGFETLDTIKQTPGLENLPIIVFTGKNLSKGEEGRIRKYADSIVVKTAYSYQRILDEAGLFLHLVEEKNKKTKSPEVGYEGMPELRNILKGKTVLIADDDVRNIFSLTKAFEMQNMNVIAAMDGKEALKLLEQNSKVDIVLMDMMMPALDGYETIKEIRKKPQYRFLPILAVTAKAMMGDREKCIAVGASDYISKPVDIDQLVSLLRVWLYDKQ